MKKALLLCKKHKAHLVAAKLDRLSLEPSEIFRIKKNLKNRLICCDLPITDRLTISTYIALLNRQKKIRSLICKSSSEKRKSIGSKLGNAANLTPQ